jgi:catechol 2,3-dioxygenase
VADGRSVGISAAFLAAGDYHHHVGLNTFETAGAPPPAPGHTGLYHVAFLYPDARELARAVRRLQTQNYPVSHATDHGATLSVYLEDPDGNGIELYVDRARALWRDENGQPILRADRVPIEQVTRALEQAPD